MNKTIVKIIIALVLGLLAPLVFILGAEPFEVRGGNSFAEILSGSVAMAAYLAFCQWRVALKEEPSGSATIWPVSIGLTAALLAWIVFMACVESSRTVVTQGLPMLAAGVCGIGAGAVLTARRADKRKAV